MPWVWKASIMGNKHIYLCGNKFIWVAGWQTYFATWFFTARHVKRSMAMLTNHVFFHVSFSPKAWNEFGRPQTWSLNTYIWLGTSLIGWLDDNHTLPHDFSLPDKSSKKYGHAHQPCVFPCWLLNQGLTWVWKASNMVTKHIYLCGNKFNWVLDDKPTLPHDFSLPDTSSNYCDHAH